MRVLAKGPYIECILVFLVMCRIDRTSLKLDLRPEISQKVALAFPSGMEKASLK